ncbi:unnamed protein product, partial [marine sediment metagenome]
MVTFGLNAKYGVSFNNQPSQQGPVIQFQAHMNLRGTTDVAVNAGSQFFQSVGIVSDSTSLDDFSLHIHYYEIMLVS